jgi:hypothetical protein
MGMGMGMGMGMEERNIPKRLYKYRAFDGRTLDMLVSDHVYYVDPSNDPLDTQPSLKIDVPVAELQEILLNFTERRAKAEMSAAAETIKYSGPKTIDHLKRHSRLASRTVHCGNLVQRPGSGI